MLAEMKIARSAKQNNPKWAVKNIKYPELVQWPYPKYLNIKYVTNITRPNAYLQLLVCFIHNFNLKIMKR